MIQTSVIIVSYNRQLKIQRYLDFFSNYRVNVIIVDGTERRLYNSVNFSQGDAFIRYVHLPGENKYLDRVIKGLQLVVTKYFCLIDDSDVIMPSSLVALEKFLEKNLDFCVAGQVYNLNILPRVIEINLWGKWSKPMTINENNPYLRILKVLRIDRTGNTFYVIASSKIRTQLIKNLKIAIEINRNFSTKFSELVWAISILSILKFKKMPIPFWIRSGIQMDSKEFIPNVENRHEIKDKEIKYLKKYLERISQDKNSKIELNNYQINKIIEVFVNNALAQQELNSNKQIVRKIIRVTKKYLKSIFPNRILHLLNALKEDSTRWEHHKITFEDDLIEKVYKKSITVRNDIRLALSYWYFKN